MYGGCQPPSRSSQWSLRVAVRGASSPPRSSQRSLRVAAKAASFNSLAHWASASLFPPLAALGSAPLPLLKKAGENLLENFSGFATDYAGPPLIGSGGLVWFAGRQGGKGWWMDRLDGGKSRRSRGGGGRAQRAQRRSGGLWPPPLRWFCGPSGPAKRRRPPGVTQRRPPTPCASAPPPALRRLARRAGRSGRPCGGGGVQGPRPKAPAPEHARSRDCPAAGGWASPTRRRPPPLGFPPTPKRQRKNPAFRPTQPRHVHHPEKGGSDREPLRNSYPKATAASPVAGYGLRPPTVAVARLSPCAQHQPSRRKGAGLFPGGRAHETLAGRVAATPSPLWQSRCPRPTGSGGFIRPAAGCCRRAASPPVARRSLPA